MDIEIPIEDLLSIFMYINNIKNQSSFFSSPSSYVSIFALVLSAFSIFWNIHKSKQDKLKSIIDDFWLRQYVLPGIIDAIRNLKAKSGNLDIPVDDDNRSANQEKFYIEIQNEIRPLKSALDSLELISEKHASTAYEIIDKFDEIAAGDAPDIHPKTAVNNLISELTKYVMNEVHKNVEYR